MSINKIRVEIEPDKPISIGQLYHFENRPVMVIKITVPKDDSIDFEKDYFAIVSLETGWVGVLSESLQELEDRLFDESYEQVKTKVYIEPGN